MYNYISKIGNICFGIFGIVLFVSLLILIINGGLFPEGFRKQDIVRNGFDVPLYFIKVTDRDRAYAKVTYNKLNAMHGGAYEVQFTSSPEKAVGIQSNGFTFDKFGSMTFNAKADRTMVINVVFHHRQNTNYLYYPIKLTPSWETYKINIGDIKQETKDGHKIDGKLTKNDFGPYIEWSYPKTEKRTSGTFWLDDLEIKSFI